MIVTALIYMLLVDVVLYCFFRGFSYFINDFGSVKAKVKENSVVMGVIIGLFFSVFIFFFIIIGICIFFMIFIPNLESNIAQPLTSGLFRTIVFAFYFGIMCYAFKLSKANDRTRKGLLIIYLVSYIFFTIIYFLTDTVDISIVNGGNAYILFKFFCMGINSIKEAMIAGVIYDSILQMK